MEKDNCAAQLCAPADLSDTDGFRLLNRYRNALMGFAALWIYVFHEWQPVSDDFKVLFWIECFIKKLGFCGVDIFLFLAGMGITYSIEKSKNIMSFYYKRIKRVILPFVLVAVLNYFFDGWSLAQFWENVLCISFFRTNIYEFLWFVPAILVFYFFSPLYYRMFTRSSGKIRFTLCVLIIWLMCSLAVRNIMRYEMFGFTDRIPIFVIGILAGWFAQNRNPVFDRLTWKLLVLAFLLGIYLGYLSGYQGMYILVPVSDCCLPNILMAVSLSFLFARFLLSLGGEVNLKPRLFRKIPEKILSFFGTFTLELYCVQEWMGFKVLPLIPHYNNLITNIILFSIIMMSALALHYISKYFWIFVEWTVKKLYNVYSKT